MLFTIALFIEQNYSYPNEQIYEYIPKNSQRVRVDMASLLANILDTRECESIAGDIIQIVFKYVFYFSQQRVVVFSA